MRTKKVKKIVSLFLAVLMCVTTFAGFGTTAYAAEETDEVYLISFPVTEMTTTAANGDTAVMNL